MTNHLLPEVSSWTGATAMISLAVKYLSDAVRNHRSDRTDEKHATVTDAATANSTLVAALQESRADNRALRADNRVKDARIDELEKRCDDLRDRLDNQRDEYNAQISALRDKVSEVTAQLDELRRKLNAEPPTPLPPMTGSTS